MKLRKKLLYIVLSGLMIFSICGCGKKKQSAVLTYEQNQVAIEYQFEAKKDIIEKITQITTTSGVSDISAASGSYQDLYNSIEGVTYSLETNGDQLIETIQIDATNKGTLAALADQGLLQLDGNASALSFQKTVDNLMAQGWKIQED